MNIIDKAFKGEWISGEELRAFATNNELVNPEQYQGQEIPKQYQGQYPLMPQQYQGQAAPQSSMSNMPGQIAGMIVPGVAMTGMNIGLQQLLTPSQQTQQDGQQSTSTTQTQQGNQQSTSTPQVTNPGLWDKVKGVAGTVGSGIAAGSKWLWGKAGEVAGAVGSAAKGTGNWVLQNPGMAAGIGAGALALGGLAYYLNKRRKLKQTGGDHYRGFENRGEWLKYKIAEAKESSNPKSAQGYEYELRKLGTAKAFADRLYSDLSICRYYGEIDRPEYSIYSNSDGSITIYDKEFDDETNIVSDPNIDDKLFSAVETARQYGEVDTLGHAFYSDSEGNVTIYDKQFGNVVDVVESNRIDERFFSLVEMARQFGIVETPDHVLYSDDVGNVAIIGKDTDEVDLVNAEDRGFKVKCFSSRR